MNIIKGRFRHRLSGNLKIFFGKKIIRQLVLTFISFTFLNLNPKAQKTIDTAAIVNSIFPRGEKVSSSDNFNGVVWLNRFISPGDSLDCIVALVTFQPGVRANWHTHPGGQILIVTEGVGYYQGKGETRTDNTQRRYHKMLSRSTTLARCIAWQRVRPSCCCA